MRNLLLAIMIMPLFACSNLEPLPVVDNVDLDRFMGDWYVIANIPTWVEKDAFNAVESYSLEEDGTVATTFTFRKGGFDGEKKTYEPRGFVSEESNAIWGMQFVWPVKADYRILYLDDDYNTTIIGRNARDYVWIMSRTPTMPEKKFADAVQLIEAAGYDPNLIKKVPQKWPE